MRSLDRGFARLLKSKSSFDSWYPDQKCNLVPDDTKNESASFVPSPKKRLMPCTIDHLVDHMKWRISNYDSLLRKGSRDLLVTFYF